MKKTLYTQMNRIRSNAVPIVCVILAISILAVPAVAQVDDVFTDTFEDGDVEGWEGNSTYPEINNDSVEGDFSAYAKSYPEDSTGQVSWESGPTLDLDEEFRATATFKGNNIDNHPSQIRIGLADDEDVNAEGKSAFAIFDRYENKTYLATNGTAESPADANTDEYIADSFNNEWVKLELYSSGNGTVALTVWEYGTTKPESPQVTKTFDPSQGKFGFNVGTDSDREPQTREAWLDSVEIDGTAVTDPTLLLDTGTFLEYGGTQPYTVYDLQGEDEKRVDITENATVSSENTSVITVDESNNQLTATSDESVNERVNITATYQGRTDISHVTVASPTVDNLDILPFMYRISAMFLDRGFQMILVGLLLAIAATRVGGVFAGLGIYQMSLTAGWLIGWVPIGLAMVGLFATLFIGLNIAANIDYSVRR